MSNEKSPLNDKIREIIFRFRATPLNSGKSPSELYLNRQIRIKLDALKPPLKSRSYSNNPDTPTTRKLSVGERVVARSYTLHGKWKPGKVSKILGKLHYLIELDEGYVIQRHINQIQKSEIPLKKTVSFAPDTYKRILPQYSTHDRKNTHIYQKITSHSSNNTLQDSLESNLPHTLQNTAPLAPEMEVNDTLSANNTEPNIPITEPILLEPITLRRSQRNRKAPEYLKEYLVGKNKSKR
ncbi:hypothetical protein RN001_002681 [Aquatica leii]|uniref:Uncharacterized protein n=1 Tax=Aquatica leii TaxID=1421715 RepID=A0AAN7SSW0_9COLE|nr:hypothetical protein RN001_002681 [Aquatica leii]